MRDRVKEALFVIGVIDFFLPGKKSGDMKVLEDNAGVIALSC